MRALHLDLQLVASDQATAEESSTLGKPLTVSPGGAISSQHRTCCRRRVNTGSGMVSVVGLVGEQDAEAEQVGAGASVHLVFGVS